MLMLAWKIAPALTGCTVVKPAEQNTNKCYHVDGIDR
jgi:acyl-CoA reductase-like NAD-dependent aldehyde dehydrogenase